MSERILTALTKTISIRGVHSFTHKNTISKEHFRKMKALFRKSGLKVLPSTTSYSSKNSLAIANKCL